MISCTAGRHQSKEAAQLAAPAPAGPMSCSIRARLVSIGDYDADPNSICAKHHCTARVRIMNVYSCGPGVSVPLQEGDTIGIKFAFTIDDTRSIFPSMKVQYPGIRPGEIFTAIAEQRLRPGSEGFFTVFDYKIE